MTTATLDSEFSTFTGSALQQHLNATEHAIAAALELHTTATKRRKQILDVARERRLRLRTRIAGELTTGVLLINGKPYTTQALDSPAKIDIEIRYAAGGINSHRMARDLAEMLGLTRPEAQAVHAIVHEADARRLPKVTTKAVIEYITSIEGAVELLVRHLCPGPDGLYLERSELTEWVGLLSKAERMSLAFSLARLYGEESEALWLKHVLGEARLCCCHE